MVIFDVKHSTKSAKHLKYNCGGCEDTIFKTSFAGITAAFDHLENDFWALQHGVEDKPSSLSTHTFMNNKNYEPMFMKNRENCARMKFQTGDSYEDEHKSFIPSETYSEGNYSFDKQLDKNNNIITVNYQFAKHDGVTESSRKNKKDNYQSVRRVPHQEYSPKKKSANIKKHENISNSSKAEESDIANKTTVGNTFNTMGKVKRHDNTRNKPLVHHSESSSTTKEFKISSFYDDYMNSTPSYFACSNAPKINNYGCNPKCMGYGYSPECEDSQSCDFKIPREMHTPEKNYPVYNPHVCYIERKWNPSCQGIPFRNQKYGISQQQPNICSMHPVENDSDCCSKMKPNFPDDLNEFNCCRRPLSNIPELNCYQKHSGNCSCKNPIVEDKLKNAKERNKTAKTRKTKCFTCCKSGQVDQEELSMDTKTNCDQRKEQNSANPKEPMDVEFCHYKCAPPTPNISWSCQEQCLKKTIPNQRMYDCDGSCPFAVQSEKEYQLRVIQPQPIMKSIACECRQEHPTERNPVKKIDVDRNITIQIIPNCGQTVRSCSGINKENFPCNTFLQETPVEKQNYYDNCVRCDRVEYQPNLSVMKPASYREPQYQGYILREKPCRWWKRSWTTRTSKTPYQRTQNQVETHDCSTSPCADNTVDNYQIVTMSDCQRVLPIKNTYLNRDASLLKSLHRLNRGLLKDLFATPCPSSSSTCPKACLHKMRGAPFPTCSAQIHGLPCSEKPATTNQCCQYETEHFEKRKTSESSKDLLYECLKYLKKGVHGEYQCEEEEVDCCCYCQNLHSCCCCCGNYNSCCRPRTARCCDIKQVIPPKVEEAKPKSCRCRSVEAKQSLKNCGTIVSTQCFKKVETVCTNTEIPIKTPKLQRRVRKHNCCCCCNQPRNCCCCQSRNCCCCCEPTSCYKSIEQTSHQREHFVYCCKCEPNQIVEDSNTESSKISALEKCIESLISKINEADPKETGVPSIKENENVKISEFSNTTEESTNTNSVVTSIPHSENVLIKSITLDLCDLGEKKFSKFGVPSRRYPWSKESFSFDMPHEIFRFVGIEKFDNHLFEKVYDDPTPCLTPEVVNDEKQQDLEEQNAGGDIEKLYEVKKRYLSTICEALFDNKHDNYSTRNSIFFIKDKSNDSSDTYNNIEAENKEKEQKTVDREEKISENNLVTHPNTNNIAKLTDDKILPKQVTKNKINPKNPRRPSPKTSQSITKVSSNISKKSSNVSKTNISNANTNYTPKPFTTKTGLMSFVPSFRDTYKVPTQVKRIKRRTETPIKPEVNVNATETKKESKNIKSNENPNKIQCCESLKTYVVPNPVVDNDQTNSENMEPTKVDSNTDNNGLIESYKKEIKENKQKDKINKSFDLKKFNEEIGAFYEKCFKTPNIPTAETMIPFYNTSVSDIVKSLESRGSINSSQMISQEKIEKATVFTEECNKINFPSKSNLEYYTEVFQKSYNSNMKIPGKIMSKSDLISLN